jgi:hypothetical protein
LKPLSVKKKEGNEEEFLFIKSRLIHEVFREYGVGRRQVRYHAVILSRED